FTSATPAPVAVTANMEAATNSDVLNYNNRVNFELFDHTDFSGATYSYSQKLTGGASSQVGVAKVIKVYPGDKVKIEAYTKYYNPTATGSNLAGFASALLSAFQLPAPAPGETGTPSAGVNTWGSIVAGGGGGGSGGYPKAFVTLIMLDKKNNFLDAAWDQINGGEQVGASPKAAHDYMMKEYTAQEEGYIFVYVSNENATLVETYFDDVVITHTKSNLIQYNEYYPFGMQASASWTRENNTGNNYLYNAGAELNTTTGNYEMFFRGYDPALGRMFEVDPMASKYASITPYNYSLNSPALLNDPRGDDVSRGQIERTIRRLWRQAGPNGSATAQIKDYYASGGGGYSPYASGGGYRPYGSVEHITPGSGGNWADGWQFSDWSPNGGSATYRALHSQGFIDLGGKLFQVLGGGVLAEVIEENGQLGYYETYDFTDYSATYENNGVTYTGVAGTGARFVSIQRGGYLTFKETYDYSRTGYTPLDENVGYQIANYKMKIEVRVGQVPVYENFRLVGYKWQATVSALSKVTPRPAGDLNSNVNVSVLLNGNKISAKAVSNEGEVVTPLGWTYVGGASFDLPTVPGNVQLMIIGGWTVSGPEGVAVPVYHPLVAPVSININQGIDLKRY
ncbi:MAG: RHS repeat-associated core domain-containing protein, partial [Bacteroidota bacterium]